MTFTANWWWWWCCTSKICPTNSFFCQGVLHISPKHLTIFELNFHYNNLHSSKNNAISCIPFLNPFRSFTTFYSLEGDKNYRMMSWTLEFSGTDLLPISLVNNWSRFTVDSRTKRNPFSHFFLALLKLFLHYRLSLQTVVTVDVVGQLPLFKLN